MYKYQCIDFKRMSIRLFVHIKRMLVYMETKSTQNKRKIHVNGGDISEFMTVEGVLGNEDSLHVYTGARGGCSIVSTKSLSILESIRIGAVNISNYTREGKVSAYIENKKREKSPRIVYMRTVFMSTKRVLYTIKKISIYTKLILNYMFNFISLLYAFDQ